MYLIPNLLNVLNERDGVSREAKYATQRVMNLTEKGPGDGIFQNYETTAIYGGNRGIEQPHREYHIFFED